MAKIPFTLNVGDKENITIESLLELIETMYSDLAEAINKKPDIYERDDDAKPTDTFLSNGDININKNTGKVEMLTKHVDLTTVTWKQLS